ncbi:Protein indeterminate-domain 12 [Linum perenne]
MSSIKGGIFGVDEEELILASQQQEVVATHHLHHHLISSIANSTTTTTTSNYNGSITTNGSHPHLVKKKRNLPGNPDPKAEVIALSPKTLMAKNRFVCEICNKGFQRDQNLQLHRRGHNLPWKLKQRNSNEVIRKKVYICPELGCVHNNPARALGDLTGIKKHFSRKHGEKKWKCEKCSKKYAVQSDWKAHSKSCGTKEYKCDCGTIFSRRDSFITHRAFCDALAEENKSNPSALTIPNHQFNAQEDPPKVNLFTASLPPPPPPPMFSPAATSSSSLHVTTPLFASSASLSATALLQKAAQMGSTLGGGGRPSTPFPSTTSPPFMRGGGGGGHPYSGESTQLMFANQFFHGGGFPGSPPVEGFVNGGAAAALWKSFGGGDHNGMMTTVDFLGVNNNPTRFDEPPLN